MRNRGMYRPGKSAKRPGDFVLFLAGLSAAQIMSTLLVWHSNQRLLDQTLRLAAAGHTAIPNRLAAAHLGQWSTAAVGGLFFTLTSGAGLVLLALVGARLQRNAKRAKRSFLLILAPWALAAAAANLRGFDPILTAWVAVIPLIVLLLSGAFFRPRHDPAPAAPGPGRIRAAILAGPVVALALLWGSLYRPALFIDIRDYLLLGTGPGQAVTDFYYRYTLYPAEAFKSLAQKTQKTCHLEGFSDRRTSVRVEATLAGRGYLHIPAKRPDAVDLWLEDRSGHLDFRHLGSTVVQTGLSEFLQHPDATLAAFSAKTDGRAWLRRFTFAAVLVALPITCYGLLFFSVSGLLRRFFGSNRAAMAAALVCLAAGGGMWLLLWQGRSAESSVRLTPTVLVDAKNWRERVAALRQLEGADLAVDAIEGYCGLLDSPRVVERYWLARVLGQSRSAATHRALIGMLRDDNPIVVCMAARSLGQRGNAAAIADLEGLFEASPHWYVQGYVYRAMRSLGWNPAASG